MSDCSCFTYTFLTRDWNSSWWGTANCNGVTFRLNGKELLYFFMRMIDSKLWCIIFLTLDSRHIWRYDSNFLRFSFHEIQKLYLHMCITYAFAKHSSINISASINRYIYRFIRCFWRMTGSLSYRWHASQSGRLGALIPSSSSPFI